jgi:mannose-6-phosphate isomerase-like protein (cupin superfamily)
LRKQHKIGSDKTLEAVRKDGILIIDNELYRIYDLHVNELTLSLTELKPGKQTRGHSHTEASEIYFFVDGSGKMQVGRQEYPVEKGSVLVVPRGEFHRVINLSNSTLVFAAVFEGSRESKRYAYDGKPA